MRGFSKVFFLFPPPRPKKRVKEWVAGWARSRPTGNPLFINLGWGACCQAERLLRSPDQSCPYKQEPFAAKGKALLIREAFGLLDSVLLLLSNDCRERKV